VVDGIRLLSCITLGAAQPTSGETLEAFSNPSFTSISLSALTASASSVQSSGSYSKSSSHDSTVLPFAVDACRSAVEVLMSGSARTSTSDRALEVDAEEEVAGGEGSWKSKSSSQFSLGVGTPIHIRSGNFLRLI
jgi:hypothetical protein